MPRVDLSEFQEGAYAVVRDTVPWGLLKHFSDAGENAVDEMVRRMVREWQITDEDGNAVAKATEADIDALDARIVAAIARVASEIVQAQTPKEAGSSSTSSPETAAPTP